MGAKNRAIFMVIAPPLEAGEVGPAHPRQLRELLLRQSVALPEHLDPITRY